jgi:hypothetical protein
MGPIELGVLSAVVHTLEPDTLGLQGHHRRLTTGCRGRGGRLAELGRQITELSRIVKIYYFLFEVLPDQNSEHFEESGGAFVDCWVKSDSEREAERIAVEVIRIDGWRIQSLHDSFIAEKDRYADDPEILELYEQAEMAGESYLFNIWPAEPQEDDTIH